jgi:hypothetical protein
MRFVEGETVEYKKALGVVAFSCEDSISILVEKGDHKSKDVRVVVYKSDFNRVNKLAEK